MNFDELLRQLRHRNRLEKIRDDLAGNALLRVFKLVVPAQKRHLNERLHGLDLRGQRRPGDEGHVDIRQQKIRLQFLYQLQCIEPVAGPADKLEADTRPVDELADRAEQLLFIVRDHNAQKVLFVHAAAPFSFPARFLLSYHSFPGFSRFFSGKPA